MRFRPPEYIQLIDSPRPTDTRATPTEANDWYLTVSRGFSQSFAQDWEAGLWLIAIVPDRPRGVDRREAQGDLMVNLPAVKASDTRIPVSRQVAFLLDTGYVLVRLQLVQ